LNLRMGQGKSKRDSSEEKRRETKREPRKKKASTTARRKNDKNGGGGKRTQWDEAEDWAASANGGDAKNSGMNSGEEEGKSKADPVLKGNWRA